MTSRKNHKEKDNMTPNSPVKSGELCSLCSEEMVIFAIGECDHPVCHRCSTRMRVLCELNHCPICRADMSKVVFVREKMDFAYILTHRFPYNRKYKVYFEDENVQAVFHGLLENRCLTCGETFKSLKELEKHMRRQHSLFACEICVHHLKIFPYERKFYTRQDLAMHRRKGDQDDRSHRGHPICEFCDKRYLDNDELVRHLRKDHYFCHFCDADGISNQFYSEYTLLRDHFREAHYLCEEGDCAYVEFTNAFRDQIDFKAHNVEAHSKAMKKASQKQARTLDIEVNLKPRPMGRGKRMGKSIVSGEDYEEMKSGSRGRGGFNRRGRGRSNNISVLSEEDQLAMALKESLEEAEKQKGGHIHVVDSALLSKNKKPARVRQDSYHEQSGDFPTLDGQNKDSDSGDEFPRSNHTLAKKLAFGAHMSVQNGAMQEEDFPALGGAAGPVKPVSGHRRGKVWTLKTEDFPSLSNHRNSAASSKNDFPALERSLKSSMHSKVNVPSATKPKQPVISQNNNNLSKSNDKQTRRYREPSPEAVPVNTSSYESGADPMNQQITVIKSSDIISEKPKNMPQAAPSNKTHVSWEDDFPVLGGAPNATKPVSWGGQSNKKKNVRQSKLSEPSKSTLKSDDFPALGGERSSTNNVTNEWIKVEQPKSKTNIKSELKIKPVTEIKKTNPNKETQVKTAPENKQVKTDNSVDASQNKKKKKNKKKGGKSENTGESESSGYISDLSSEKLSKENLENSEKQKNVSENMNAQRIAEETTERELVCQNNHTSSSLEELDEAIITVQSSFENKIEDFPSLQSMKPLSNSLVISEVPKPVRKVEKDKPLDAPKKEALTLSSIAASLSNEPSIVDNVSAAIVDLNINDFPALGSSNVGSSQFKAPPGFNTVPPGFGKDNSGNNTMKEPPPGISSPPGINKNAPPGFTKPVVEELTNVNTTTPDVKMHIYQQPTGFQDRNKKLVSVIQDACQHDQDKSKFELFKQYSGLFRKGEFTAAEYFSKCQDLMGKDKFINVLSELIALLPDIEKQQELYQYSFAQLNKKKSAKKSKKAAWATTSEQNTLHLKACSQCQQLLDEDDFSQHLHENLESDFPALGGSSSGAVLKAWVKAN